MESIEVTFPQNVDCKRVKTLIENNLKTNSRFTCEVTFLRSEDGENVFKISANCCEAFYLAGMTASMIIQKFA